MSQIKTMSTFCIIGSIRGMMVLSKLTCHTWMT